MGYPQQLGRSGDPPFGTGGVPDPFKTRLSPRGLISQIWSLFVKRNECRYGEPPENWVPGVPLFRVIQDHRKWHWSIVCLWLPLNVQQ